MSAGREAVNKQCSVQRAENRFGGAPPSGCHRGNPKRIVIK
jgi:hypothetical protein